MRKIALYLLISFIAVSCSEEIKVPEKKGGIAGIVADKTTGAPVSVVNVKLKETGSSTITGSDGSFSFKELSEGTYTLNISKEGYKDNSETVKVTNDNNTECHLLIERIPAILTLDREVLDFGENYSNTTLSFSMVNKNYVDLDWEIVYSCRWIKQIDPIKSITKLGFGKTQTVVVIIDRDQLLPDNNETVIVVRTSDGASELTVKAFGSEKKLASLNMTETTDIKAYSAVLNAEITDKGMPEYTERGFVLGETSMPVKETASRILPAAVTDQNNFSVKVDELSMGVTYYARAYAINKEGIAYSTNQDKFSTNAKLPTVSILETTDITSSSAILNAKITDVGMPEYTERGFVIGTTETPTKETAQKVIPVSIDAQDIYSVKVEDLGLGETYYVRSYAINAVGVSYSINQEQFTTKAILPTVSILETTDITSSSAILNAKITDVGMPEYTERGFVIGTTETPTKETAQKVIPVSIDAQDTYSVRVGDLGLGETYYVRAYAINAVGVSYSINQEEFTTKAILPTVSILSTTDIKSSSAILNGKIADVGTPEYTERGFVIGDIEMPTKETALKVIPVAIDAYDDYSVRAGELTLGNTYYVRAYAINAVGIVYSTTQDIFTTIATLPKVTTQAASDEDLSTKTAVLHGTITNEGDPAYTERGFVWSTIYEMPTIEEEKIVISGTGVGNFEKRITFPSSDEIIYIRAYATSTSGTSYGDKIEIFVPDYYVVKDLGLGIQKTDIGSGSHTNLKGLCANSTVSSKNDWRLPTLAELQSMYNIKNEIGISQQKPYWSSSKAPGSVDAWGDGVKYTYYYYYYVNFKNGSSGYSLETGIELTGYGRCVRTL